MPPHFLGIIIQSQPECYVIDNCGSKLNVINCKIPKYIVHMFTFMQVQKIDNELFIFFIRCQQPILNLQNFSHLFLFIFTTTQKFSIQFKIDKKMPIQLFILPIYSSLKKLKKHRIRRFRIGCWHLMNKIVVGKKESKGVISNQSTQYTENLPILMTKVRFSFQKVLDFF